MIRPRLFAVVLLGVAIVQPAFAQEPIDPVAVDELPPTGIFWDIEFGAFHAFESDFDGTGLSTSEARFTSSAEFLWRAEERFTQVGIEVGYQATAYDFSGPGPGEVEPFDRLDQATLGVFLAQPLNREWAIVAGSSNRWAFAKGANFEDGLNIAAFAGIRYSFSRDFSVTFGLLVDAEPEDDTNYLPIAGIEWRISDELFLRTYNGVFLEYEPAESVLGVLAKVEGSIEYNFPTFVLEEAEAEGPLPAREAVAIRELVGKIRAAYELREGIFLWASASVIPWSEWTFRRDNRETGTFEREVFARLGLELNFTY